MKNVLILLLVLLTLQLSYCQVNSHYWSHQYGAKGLLLNGSIIASVNDETAIFYNPGAMALTEEFGISLSLITPTFSKIKTRDFLGEGTSFANEGLGLSPGLVAAMFKPFGTDKVTLGLTTFQRFKSNVNVEDRVVSPVESNSSQLFVGDLDFNRRLNESWFGIGLSARLSDRFAIGVTQFITFRTEKVGLNFKKEILDKENPANLIAGWRSNFDYGLVATGGLLSKVGICWKPTTFKIGATFTTGTYGVAVTRANYAFDDQKIGFNSTNTASSNDKSTELNSYKTPMSFGLGFEFDVEGTILSVSGEYFTKIEKYYIIDDIDDPLDGLSPNPEFTSVKIGQANEPVLNLGIGIERSWDEKYTWFYGFRTDFSPRGLFELGEGISFLASTPDIYHISSGIAYHYQKSQFSVGVDYGFGFKSGGKQLTDITNINVDNIFEFAGDDSVNTLIQQIALYITYDL